MKATFLLHSLIGLVTAFPASDVSPIEKRQKITTGRWCSPLTKLCYMDYATDVRTSFRIAIPDTATVGAAFDIAIQIVAPVNQGWTGLSWGGTMTDAPITLAWQNGQAPVLSSRWAAGRQMPTTYTQATYTILQDSGVNGTHYTLSAICKGCSSWTRGSGSVKTLSPAGGLHVAWAGNPQPNSVSQRANPASTIEYHPYHGYIDGSFNDAKVPVAQFQAAAAMVKP
ncbi:hypothetical protein jhhlp_001858 [Lomentospora prolificans]|uniref:Cellobiose dehydrogenase-like cytochrome domain-containing protein n=1 Tax=Lomentospora prolificans TaxID=41688 RepID=A0A2N3NCF7_9PEZI|nr:hypothetical protein jhhlp_001858 [Lomentospora prolificans]